MNKREAEIVGRMIDKSNRNVSVTGIRIYGRGDYSLDCIDHLSGYSFVVHSREAWEERMKKC